MNNKDWYVEYSIMQNCFHIDKMKRIQEMNKNSCKLKQSNGYVIVSGPHTMEEAGDQCDIIKKELGI